ncbi:MAG TPA: transposase [Myxococcales bacterium]|nr:transposase [Myxococcales bacterium]HIL81021.1 transposase [Myxococcales bacterium]
MKDRHINGCFIDPGSPWQNGHNESCNGVLRDGYLNRWLFESVREARGATEAWLYEYNGWYRFLGLASTFGALLKTR